MTYKVIPIEKFKKEAKRLVRKYPSLKKELSELTSLLQANCSRYLITTGQGKPDLNK